MKCKYCQSQNIIKYGTHNEVQRYYCKDCKRKFVADSLPRMRTPSKVVASAVGMYYGGMSLDAIQRQVTQDTGKHYSEVAIYKWITRFTKQAIAKTKDFKPEVGDVWIADETGIDVHTRKRDIWFWDIIDAKTRYLLASHVSISRTTEDAQELIKQAIIKAGKVPKVIITDKLRSYIDGIKFTSDQIEHIQSKPFVTENSTNKIERFHGTFKDRIKVVRAFKNMTTARLLTDGWLIHYNFFKEHEALNNTPPVHAMGLNVSIRDWNDIVSPQKQIVATKQVVPESTGSFFRPLTIEQTNRQQLRLKVRQAVQKHAVKKRLKRQQVKQRQIQRQQRKTQPTLSIVRLK